MSFIFKNFLTFKGRINRKRYIFLVIPVYILSLISGTGMIYAAQMGLSFLEILCSILLGLLSISNISLNARRLHDFNISAWFLVALALTNFLFIRFNLLNLMSAISFVLMLVLLLKKGTNGPNSFGNDPLQTTKQ